MINSEAINQDPALKVLYAAFVALDEHRKRDFVEFLQAQFVNSKEEVIDSYVLSKEKNKDLYKLLAQ
jgi:hypothetical protein